MNRRYHCLLFGLFVTLLLLVSPTYAKISTYKPPQEYDYFTSDEITFDKSGDDWVYKNGDGDIIGLEISGRYESIALIKKRIEVDLSRPLIIEYRIRFNFRDSDSHATVNVFLNPPADEDWWNDPIGVGHNGEINGGILNFLHNFGHNSCWGGKVGVDNDVEGGSIPCRSAPYPKDGEWVTVKIIMNEDGFEVTSVGDQGYYREEQYEYDLSDVNYIAVGFGDQLKTRVEVDYIKIYYGPVAIETDKERYKLGDTIKLKISLNWTSKTPVTAKFKLELKEPNNSTDEIYESHPFTMSPRFEYTGIVTFAIPKSYFVVDGEYSFIAKLTEATTGVVLGRDVAKFTIDDSLKAIKLTIS